MHAKNWGDLQKELNDRSADLGELSDSYLLKRIADLLVDIAVDLSELNDRLEVLERDQSPL